MHGASSSVEYASMIRKPTVRMLTSLSLFPVSNRGSKKSFAACATKE